MRMKTHLSHTLILLSFLFATLSAHAKPLLVGHRGSLYGVENTEQAFRSGAALGYHYVETDIKVTKDTRFVLTHDDNLSRWGHSDLTIASSTLAQLQAVTLTQTRSGTTYTGKLMELGEFLDLCAELNVKPVIELKWGTGVNSNDQSNMPQLIKTIEEHGFRNTCVILTSMKPCLEWIRTNHPDINLQLLINAAYTSHINWCKQWNIDVDIAEAYCTDEAVEAYHEAGLKVNMWTTNTDAGYKTYATMGCDFITTDYLDGNNLPAYDPKVVLPTIEGDYPDSLSGTTITPSNEYTFRQEYINQPLAILEGKTIRRVLTHRNHVYILALDTARQPTLLRFNPQTQAHTLISTAGMHTPEVISKADSTRLLACSDIQVSQDGVLLATNLSETNGDGNGQVFIYKWENDADGLPTGEPTIWIRSQANGALQNAYTGETFAYSGTTQKGNAYLSAEAISSTANLRFVAIPIIAGTATERAFVHSTPPARGYMKRPKVGDDYRFTLSPLASNHIIVTGSGTDITVSDFEFVKKGNTSPVEIPDALDIKTTHISFFKFAGETYAALPHQNTASLFRLTNTLTETSYVPTHNTAFEPADQPAAVVAQIYPTRDETGNITRADLDLFVLAGNKASLFTTRGTTDALHQIENDALPVTYYTLTGTRIDEKHLTTGTYIRLQGTNATKIFIP